MPGRTILQLSPGIVRRFHQKRPNLVQLADQDYHDVQEAAISKLPSSDDDSADEEEGQTPLEVANRAPIVGHKVSWLYVASQIYPLVNTTRWRLIHFFLSFQQATASTKSWSPPLLLLRREWRRRSVPLSRGCARPVRHQNLLPPQPVRACSPAGPWKA